MKQRESYTSKALMCERMKLKYAFTCIVEYINVNAKAQ